MIKTLANKFRSYCGSVLSVNSQSLGETRPAPGPGQHQRAPDCAYVTHAGIMGARRHSKDNTTA